MPFFLFWVIKRIIHFSSLELFFETQTGYSFPSLAYETLKAITGLFFLIFGYFITSQLYLYVKGTFFDIVSDFFNLLHDLMQVLQAIGSIFVVIFIHWIYYCFFVCYLIGKTYI